MAFLLFAANVVFTLAGGQGIGVVDFFVFIGLLNGLRGTFGWPKFAEAGQPEAAA
jgi:hypothetical protein